LALFAALSIIANYHLPLSGALYTKNTMQINWKVFEIKDFDELAENWFTEIELNDCTIKTYRNIVNSIHEYTNDEFLWCFIERAMQVANNDSDLEHLAAGPVYFFIEYYGDNWIDLIERKAKSHHRFAKLLTGVWKSDISDSLWHRVEAIQYSINDPLPW